MTGVIPARGPGGMPPIENIILWIKLKRDVKANPWAIAKTIAAKGTAMYRGEKKPLDFEAIVREERTRLMMNLLKGTAEEILIPIRNAINKN